MKYYVHVKIQVKIQYHEQILDTQERAAYLQFLHDLGKL